MTGIDNVAATDAVCGAKMTVRVQVPPAANVEHPLATLKLGSETLGVPIVRLDVPLSESVIVCCVLALPGTLAKFRLMGLIATPGSAEPNPLRLAMAVPAEVTIVSVPLRVPVADGANRTCTKHDAVAAREPLHEAPPVELATMEKSPLAVRDCTVAAVAEVRRFASVKVIGADELFTAMGPKSCATGVSTRPCTGRAVAVSVNGYAFPLATVESVSEVVAAPAFCDRNCTPR